MFLKVDDVITSGSGLRFRVAGGWGGGAISGQVLCITTPGSICLCHKG